MTLVEPSPVAGPARTALGGRARLRRWVTAASTEHVVVLGLLTVVVLPLARAGGGRDPGALAWAVVPAIAALVVTRPWRRLDVRVLGLVAAVAMAAAAVLVLTGGGRAGAVTAGTYGFTGVCGLVVMAYARTAARRAAVAGVLCAGGVAQFAWALVPWWGLGDPSRPMVGTYDWHNQYAAALLAPALLGLALAVAGRRPWRSAGWVAAPLAVAGIVLSTSRATLALLVLGLAGRARAGRRAGAGPRDPWLGDRPGPGLLGRGRGADRSCSRVRRCSRPAPRRLQATTARAAAGETLENNSTYRIEFWREALVAFGTDPVVGAGYGRVASTSVGRIPVQWAVSPLAHSGPLQALGEGGLLLAVPLLALLGAAALGLLRRLRRTFDLERPDALVLRAAVVVALLLGAHALVDTDWSYPALAAQAAAVTGIALGVPLPSRGPRVRPAAGLVCVLLLAAALGGVGAAAWGQPFHISAPNPDRHTTSGGGHS